MNIDHEKFLEILNSTQLPVLPIGVAQLIDSLGKEDITFIDLAELLEQYPTITARLISLANSAWSSPIEPVYSLEIACSRIGLNIVKSTSIALAVGSTFSPSLCPTFDVPRFWCRAMMVANIASSLAQVCPDPSLLEIGKTAGLLHNLGLLWLASQIPDETNQILQLHQSEEGVSLGELFIDKFGFDYCDAGAFLAKEWGLPGPFISSIELHRKPELYLPEGNAATLIGQAVSLAQAVEYETPELMPDSTETLGITTEDMNKQYSRTLPQLKKSYELAQAIF